MSVRSAGRGAVGRRIPLLLLAAFALPLAFTPSARAQRQIERGEGLEVGDEVEIQIGDDWLPGKVLSVTPPNAASVQYEFSGRTITQSTTFRRLRWPAGSPGVNDALPSVQGDNRLPSRGGAAGGSRTDGGQSGGGRSNGGPTAPGRDSSTESYRTWTAAGGKYAVKAKLKEVKDGMVWLTKEDGKTVDVEISKLSQEDQDFISQLDDQTDNPFAGGTSEKSDEDEFNEAFENDPHVRRLRANGAPERMIESFRESRRRSWDFRRRMQSGKELEFSANDSQSGLQSDGGELTHANWSKVKTIVPNANVWRVEPDPAAALGASISDNPVVIQPAGDGHSTFFEKMEGMRVTDAGLAYVGFANRHPGKDVACRIEVIDFAGGSRRSTIPLPAGMEMMDVSPDRQLLLTRLDQGFGFGKKTRLDLWRLSGGEREFVIAWEPYANASHQHLRDVSTARFVGDSKVATLGNGMFVIWDVESASAELSIAVHDQSVPAFSAGGRYVALGTTNGIAIIDCQKGESAGLAALTGFPPNKVAFSPSGERLAAARGQEILTWSLKDGSLEREFHTPAYASGGLHWLNEDFLLLNGRYLVDVDKRVVAWDYQGGGDGLAAAVVGDRYCYMAADGRRSTKGFFCSTLPHEAAVSAVQALPSAEQLLALQPGSSVAINLQFASAGQQEVHQAFVERLRANGIQVVGSSPIVIEALVVKGQPQEVTYREFGTFREYTRTVTPHSNVVRVTENGKVIWSVSSSSGVAGSINLQQNETIDQALHRLSQPNIEFFKGATLPKYLARGGHALGLGGSMIGFGGFAPASPMALN